MTGSKTNFWGEPMDRPVKVEGSCISRTVNAGCVGAGAGTFFAACQLAWYPDAVQSAGRFAAKTATSDSKAIMRAIARPSFWMASAATAFAAAECTAEAARGKSDSFNAAIGGMAGGFVMGAMSKKPGIAVSSSLAMGLFMFAMDMTGPNTVFGDNQAEVTNRMYGHMPKTHEESSALASLKEKYPSFKDL